MSDASIPAGYVDATWVGPYSAQILQHDGTLVDATPGDTVCIIPEGEAEGSAHWRPVRHQKHDTKTDSKKGDS